MYRKVRELSGNFSVCSKFWLVKMHLCERPAGQGREQSYLPLPRGVRIGYPDYSIGKIQTQIRAYER